MSLALFFGLGITLLLFSRPIAKRIVSQNEHTVSLKATDTKVLQAIAFSVVGIVLICLAFPKLFQLAVNISTLEQPGIETSMRERISKDTFAFGVAIGAQFMIGLLLFLGGQFLAHLWHSLVERFRYERNITSG